MPLACFVSNGPSRLAQVGRGAYYLVSTYLGFIYIFYIFTIPMFGWPGTDTENGSDAMVSGTDTENDSDAKVSSWCGAKISKWCFPEPPHLGPVRHDSDAGYCFKMHRAAVNLCAMLSLPYVLIILSFVVIGVMIVVPPVFVLLGLFMVLIRWTNAVAESMQDRIKEVGDAEKKIDKEGSPEVDADSFIKIPNLEIQVPWWTLPSFDMYVKMGRLSIAGLHLPRLHLPECRLSCSIKAGFHLFCFGLIELFRLFYFGLIDLFLFQIALPSFVFFIKFYLDTFFVLTIIKSFILAFPSFKLFNLPSFDFDFHFRYFFSFRLPSLVLPFPTWKGSCGSTRDLGTTLNLAAAVFTASAIITSDIMVALFDRLRRAQMIKKGYDDAVKAMEDKDTKDISWLKWGMKKAKKAAKGSFSAQIGVIQTCTYFILWVTGLVMNVATMSFAELATKLPMSKQEPWFATDCTSQMWIFVKILQFWMLLSTCCYFLQVLSGKVHKAGIYILSAALTTEETLCKDSYSGSRWEGVRRLGALLWLVLGQFLAPMLPVGLRKADAWLLQGGGTFGESEMRDLKKKMKEGLISVHCLRPEVRETLNKFEKEEKKKATEVERPLAGFSTVYIGLTNMFQARERIVNCLYGLTTTATSEGKLTWHVESRNQPNLKNTDDFRLDEYHQQIHQRQERGTFVTCVTAFTSPFAIMGDWQAQSSYVTERCLVWQAQLESVYLFRNFPHSALDSSHWGAFVQEHAVAHRRTSSPSAS